MTIDFYIIEKYVFPLQLRRPSDDMYYGLAQLRLVKIVLALEIVHFVELTWLDCKERRVISRELDCFLLHSTGTVRCSVCFVTVCWNNCYSYLTRAFHSTSYCLCIFVVKLKLPTSSFPHFSIWHKHGNLNAWILLQIILNNSTRYVYVMPSPCLQLCYNGYWVENILKLSQSYRSHSWVRYRNWSHSALSTIYLPKTSIVWYFLSRLNSFLVLFFWLLINKNTRLKF